MEAAARLALRDRLRGALWGIFIADALSMPAHWFYDVRALKREYGRIESYVAPCKYHPTSIMSLHSTGGAGRGEQKGRIIGDVINHGKRGYWGVRGTHYHVTLSAGDNTLNALCARLAMRSIVGNDGVYSSSAFLDDYIAFMTTPGTHNDTYAESYHRQFFARWSAGIAADDCAGEENHDTASIGAWVTLPPVLADAYVRSDGGDAEARTEAVAEAALAHTRLTHRSSHLEKYTPQFARLFARLLDGQPLREAVVAAGDALGVPVAALHGSGASDDALVARLGLACYIDSSFPVVLALAYRYGDFDGDSAAAMFEAALLANTNAGGENCHRGSALGSLFGAAVGYDAIPKRFIDGLSARDEIEKEVESLLDALLGEEVKGAAGEGGGGAGAAGDGVCEVEKEESEGKSAE